MLCGELNGKEIQRGGDIHIHVADSLSYTAETQHCKAIIFQLKKKKKRSLCHDGAGSGDWAREVVGETWSKT